MARAKKQAEVEKVWKGPESLRPLLVPIADIAPDPKNARKHKQRSVQGLVASLGEFGQRKPIVVRSDGAVTEAGHGLTEAARSMGWTHVAVVMVDDDEATAKRYALADNRTAELSDWDYEELKVQMDELDMSAWWTDVEILSLKAIGQAPELPGFDGMPSYEVSNKNGARLLVVHFATDEDVGTFKQKLGIDFGDAAKFIWYPEQAEDKVAGKVAYQ